MCVILLLWTHVSLAEDIPLLEFPQIRELHFGIFKTTAWQLLVFPRQLCDWERGFEWWLSARKIERCHRDTFYPVRVYIKCGSIISFY